MYKLSQSIWPRQGYNQQNNSLIPYSGAINGKLLSKIKLPHSLLSEGSSSVVVCDDKTLRVVNKGILSAITLVGEVIWSKKIAFKEFYSSLIALEGNKTLIYTVNTLYIYDKAGELELEQTLPAMFEYTVVPANITYDGYIVIGSRCEGVFLISDKKPMSLNTQGYDTGIPAIDKNNNILIADYSGLGACSFDTNSTKIYSNKTCYDVDLLPVVNSKGITVMGCLNDKMSYFLDTNGNILYKRDVAALYTEYIDGGWIELSKNKITRLTKTYEVEWTRHINLKSIYSLNPPIVDNQGFIYLSTDDGFFSIKSNGATNYKMPNKDSVVSIVENGKMCFVEDDHINIFI